MADLYPERDWVTGEAFTEAGVDNIETGVRDASTVINAASSRWGGHVGAVAAASAGQTVHFPAGTYINPAGIGNGITVPADNVTLDFSPGVTIQVQTWGQPGIDAIGRSGLTVRGKPTIQYVGTRGTPSSAGSIRGSAGDCNACGVYINRDRCTIDGLRTIGMPVGVFLSSWNGSSSVDRQGVGNTIRDLEWEGGNFGILWVGQKGLRIDGLYCHDDNDDSSGVNPTHAYYCSATTGFRSTDVTISNCIADNIVAGQAYQLKYCDNTTLTNHVARNCAGLINVIDCNDLHWFGMSITDCRASLTVPQGAITFQGTGSQRPQMYGTSIVVGSAGDNNRAVLIIADDAIVDGLTVFSKRTSNANASIAIANLRGTNNLFRNVTLVETSAYPPAGILVGDGTTPSTGTEISNVHARGVLRLVSWLAESGGSVDFKRMHVEVTSGVTVTSSGSPVFQVYEDGVLTGAGSPEGVVTAAVGAIFKRSDGGVGTSLYSKTSGTGNTGWTAL